VDRKLPEPEAIRSENRLHFILPLGESDPVDFCFSFWIDGDRWRLQHVECIFVRMDRIGALPVSSFPDLSEEQKAWAREEIRVSEMVRLYTFLVAKRDEFALDWFRDGEGICWRTAWVPAHPSRALSFMSATANAKP
jgi:hypothetical protein